jgi:hypothetical protein
MRFAVSNRDVHLEVVARSSPEELVVVGITGYGVRIFAARQRGRVITVEDATTRNYEHLARWSMDALHRSLWIQPPAGAGSDRVLSWAWEDEQVVESGKSGTRLREFSRTGTSAVVSVRYRERSVEIRNPWCGYDAVFVVLDEAGDRETPHD